MSDPIFVSVYVCYCLVSAPQNTIPIKFIFSMQYFVQFALRYWIQHLSWIQHLTCKPNILQHIFFLKEERNLIFPLNLFQINMMVVISHCFSWIWTIFTPTFLELACPFNNATREKPNIMLHVMHFFHYSILNCNKTQWLYMNAWYLYIRKYMYITTRPTPSGVSPAVREIHISSLLEMDLSSLTLALWLWEALKCMSIRYE